MTIEEAFTELYIHYVGEKNIARDKGETTKQYVCSELASLCWKLKKLIKQEELI